MPSLVNGFALKLYFVGGNPGGISKLTGVVAGLSPDFLQAPINTAFNVAMIMIDMMILPFNSTRLRY